MDRSVQMCLAHPGQPQLKELGHEVQDVLRPSSAWLGRDLHLEASHASAQAALLLPGQRRPEG